MAETGKTPIQLYHSTTPAAVPLAADLLPGEIGLNIADNKAYTDDGAGNVKQILGSLGAQDLDNVNIDGGTINNVTITNSTVDGPINPDYVILPEQAVKPTVVATEGAIYTKDVAGVTCLFYENDDGDEIQLTSGSTINIDLPDTTIAPQNTITELKTYSQYYRGKVIVVPIVTAVATIDWLAATTFIIEPNNENFTVDFINIPDTSVMESQVIYIVFNNTGACGILDLNPALGITVKRPSSAPDLGPLTTDGQDVYTCAIQALDELFVFPVMDMITD